MSAPDSGIDLGLLTALDSLSTALSHARVIHDILRPMASNLTVGQALCRVIQQIAGLETALTVLDPDPSMAEFLKEDAKP